MYGGFPALEDDTFMVRGAIMQAVATLAIYDQKTGNLRFADNLRRMSSRPTVVLIPIPSMCPWSWCRR